MSTPLDKLDKNSHEYRRKLREFQMYTNIEADAERYVKARPVLDALRILYKARSITWEQHNRIRKMALDGDDEGARTALRAIYDAIEERELNGDNGKRGRRTR